ncbi:Hypothetical protein LUCI_1223 [Lucifera butyrica]|uniref:Bacterial extracellular solute-binding protein n=1 Tax=Lucifera butyrica TaxID=1351585 RepID=A0A498R6W9_9FIRM|nr:extracellular solute-binding protein [Lucifera butyrica]VBB06012.1 Hypothetical protein LUCI_1223 [Lucifera butyrica]
MRRYLPLILISVFLLVFLLAGGTYLAGYANKFNQENQNAITVYTTLPVEQASALAKTYEQKSNIPVNIVILSTSDLLKRLELERDKPQADIVLADRTTLDQVKKLHVLAAYNSEQTDLIPQRFRDATNLWTGLWYDPIVFAVNLDYLKNTSPVPSKWTDLANGKSRLAITDFLASDVSANILYALVSARGEKETLNYFKKIHSQIVQYAKFIATPVRMAGMGEADIGIAPLSEATKYLDDDFPVRIIYPQDGSPYLLTGAGLIQGALHNREARQFLEWLLTDPAQIALLKSKYHVVPTNPATHMYKSFAGKKIVLLEKKNLGDAREHQLLDKWVQTVRLNMK